MAYGSSFQSNFSHPNLAHIWVVFTSFIFRAPLDLQFISYFWNHQTQSKLFSEVLAAGNLGSTGWWVIIYISEVLVESVFYECLRACHGFLFQINIFARLDIRNGTWFQGLGLLYGMGHGCFQRRKTGKVGPGCSELPHVLWTGCSHFPWTVCMYFPFGDNNYL